MEQSSDDSKKESKIEDNIQKLLEQNKINTQALRKLLKFIEEKKSTEDKLFNESRDKVTNKIKN
jgi:hypothetical protein